MTLLQNKSKTGPRRDSKGRLLKGSTANPGGRPKLPQDAKEALKAMMPGALERLRKMLESKNERVAMRAIEVVLDRALGRVSQRFEHDSGPTLEELIMQSRMQPEAEGEGLG